MADKQYHIRMISNHDPDITRLLLEFDPQLTVAPQQQERLLDLVYAELRATARGLMSRERIEHTLQPTALVHEAWLKIINQERVQWQDRAHFLGIAARCMRQVLVDHARAHGAAKRGGEFRQVTLDEGLLAGGPQDLQLLDLDDCLTRLAELDARAAQVAEMRIFGGATVAEIAHNLQVSKRTVDGDWSMARLWLTRELGDS
ncbi:MAG: ECF-type sigma factor [Candidatus Krumholzibacteria bacterium]|nr:ECF-type sigma factor [Candidatus Krumholzibacteria bacterium]